MLQLVINLRLLEPRSFDFFDAIHDQCLSNNLDLKFSQLDVIVFLLRTPALRHIALSQGCLQSFFSLSQSHFQLLDRRVTYRLAKQPR